MVFSDAQKAALRRETPGVDGRLHLDNCGSALMPVPVVNAYKAHLDLEARVGGYVAQEQQAPKAAALYDALASLLGGNIGNYAFAGSAVDAWTKAFYSVPMGQGDNIVTAYNEYCSNFIAYLHVRDTKGVEIRVAGTEAGGALNLTALERLIDDRTVLVSLSHVPSSSGQVNDVAAVGRIARRHGVPFLLDACQSVGQLPVNVDEIGCDMLTGTGRKFLRGPRGTGFLYVREEMMDRLDPVMLTNQSAAWTSDNEYDLRGDARLFEAWERCVAGQIALGVAVDYLLNIGIDRAAAAIKENADYLRAGLGQIRGVVPECPPVCTEDASCAIITFNKDGYDAAELKAKFDALGVGIQIASVMHTRLDLGARGIETAARVSPHYYNDKDEIDRFLNLLEDM